MVERAYPVTSGILLGIGPTVVLTSAATMSPWLAVLGTGMMLAGMALASVSWRHGQATIIGMTGVTGGIVLALANLFYPVGPAAFPGGPGMTWLAAMLMFGGGTPLLHPIHKKHATLRAIAVSAGIVEPGQDDKA